MPSEEATPTPLLQTKLYKPRLSQGLIPHPRLLDQLEQERERPLTLVVAPAGYGKTTQVTAYLYASDWPSAWFSLDEEDRDLNLFLSYVLAAIQSIFPDACSKTAVLLKATAEFPPEVMSTLKMGRAI